MRLFYFNQWGCTDNVRLIRNSLLSKTLLTSNETTVCRKPSSFAPATMMMLPNRCNWRLLWKTFYNGNHTSRPNPACMQLSIFAFIHLSIITWTIQNATYWLYNVCVRVLQFDWLTLRMCSRQFIVLFGIFSTVGLNVVSLWLAVLYYSHAKFAFYS